MRKSTDLTPQTFVALSGAARRDDIFLSSREGETFEFSSEVTSVFPDMIGRSVPGYWENVEWLGRLCQPFLRPSCLIYDLGCSLGAVGWSIDRHLEVPVSLVAVDSSQAMIERLRGNLAEVTTRGDWAVIHADITQISFRPTRLVTMHYCLQFVPIDEREALLYALYDALEVGGALFISEKIRGENESEQLWLRTQHHDFKRRMGYSELEIAGKAESIAHMMPVETISTHESRLKKVGFTHVYQWRRSLNFVSWVAIK